MGIFDRNDLGPVASPFSGSASESGSSSITGGASSIVTSDLTASKALVSNASGKVDVSSVTSAEIGYVSGVTSAVQTQIDGKASNLLSNLGSSTAVNANILPVSTGYYFQVWETPVNNNDFYFTNKSAFSFTPSENMKLKAVSIYRVRNTGANQGNTSKVVIYGSTGSAPNLSDVKGETPTRLNSSIIDNSTQEYTFSSGISLTSGTLYWLSLEETGSAYSLGVVYPSSTFSSTWRTGVNLENITASRAPLHKLLSEGDGSAVNLGSLTKPFAQAYQSALRLPGSTRQAYAELKSPALSSSLSWTLPSSLGTSGQVLQTDNSGNLSWAATPAANTLNNLSTTSINSDLIPSANGTRSIGNGSFLWNTVYAQRISITNSYEIDSRTMPNGGSAYALGAISTGQPIGLMTFSGSSSGSTGAVRIESGNNTGTGASGDIKMFAGTTASGSRGKVEMIAAKIDASGSTGPFRVPVLTADPGSPLDGEVWYNSTDNKMRIRANGVTVNLN